MHITRTDLPAKIEAPGALARQATEFGDASGYGTMAAEWFSLAAGTDIAPLLQGLKDDGCQAPHWGYLTAGAVVVTYTDGREERCRGGDLFYWPPGHVVRVEEDADVILFSPQKEHLEALDHMTAKMAGA